MKYVKDNLNLEYFNRFLKFVENKDNNSSIFGDKFTYKYEFDEMESLAFEEWRYSFPEYDSKKSDKKFIILHLIHKGLKLDDIKNEIQNNNSYEVLVYLNGYYSVLGLGENIYLDLLDYKEVILDLIESNFNIGGVILNFISNYLNNYGFSLKKDLKDVFYEKYCKDYEYYIKDIDLDKNLEKKYANNRILHEEREFTTTNKIGKLNRSHRFLILSTHNHNFGTDFNFEVFKENNGHYKVLDVYHYKNKTQITLLHLPHDLWQIFEVEYFNYGKLIDDARSLFIKSFNTEIIDDLEDPKWINCSKFSLGLDKNGEYNKTFFTVHTSNGYTIGKTFLDLKSEISIVLNLLLYNFPKIQQGKFPAPQWLVYPQISPGSIGWRMGCGEAYIDNFYDVIKNIPKFKKLFPEPLNWSLKYAETFNKYIGTGKPYFSIGWNEKGTPKYNSKTVKITSEEVIWFNDIFDSNFFKEEFILDADIFKNFDDAIKISKTNTGFQELNIKKREEVWDKTKYSLYLNLLYFRIMPNKSLREKLLKTNEKIILYESTDKYWGVKLVDGEYTGENNLGFALMELRDEINRLYKNNNHIDWFYTEFLKNAPYNFRKYLKNEEDTMIFNLNNKQSPEYKIFEATYANCEFYVRDVDMDENLVNKYKKGMIIQERAFVDVSNKIGGINTNTRFTILSNHIADLTEFEHDTNWGLHTASANSIFKVLDIYKYRGKTQILLLHLLDEFWEIFKDNNTIDNKYVNKARNLFIKAYKSEVISSLDTEIWKDRCSFPIGLDNNGEFWEINDK